MKKFVIAAAMAAALTTPAMANEVKTAGSNTAVVSTQGVGLGGILGGASLTTGTTIMLATMIVTTLTVAGASSGSGT